MRNLSTAFLGVMLILTFASISAQSPRPAAKSAAAKKYTVPRTPWGDPDLQGIWPSTHMLGVPFQRPDQLAGKTALSDEELRQREEEARRQAEQDNEEFVAPRAGGAEGGGTGPPGHWSERGRPQRQTSLIVEPADGKMPPMTPEGQRRASAVTTSFNDVLYRSPEDFSLYDRCITRGVLGSMMPVIYTTATRSSRRRGRWSSATR